MSGAVVERLNELQSHSKPRARSRERNIHKHAHVHVAMSRSSPQSTGIDCNDLVAEGAVAERVAGGTLVVAEAQGPPPWRWLGGGSLAPSTGASPWLVPSQKAQATSKVSPEMGHDKKEPCSHDGVGHKRGGVCVMGRD